MKLKKIICGLIGFCLTLSLTINTKANTLENIKDLPEIKPYQEVINKLNNEFNSDISIPDNKTIKDALFNREDIYADIISQTPTDFENNLRKEYKDFISNDSKNNYSTDEGERVFIPFSENKELNNSINPKSVSERIVQKEFLYNGNGENRGAVDLESQVFSGSGNPGTFSYSTIYGYSYYKFTDRTHFRITNYSESGYTFSNNSKVCTVKYVGSHFTANGLLLTGKMIYTIPYTA